MKCILAIFGVLFIVVCWILAGYVGIWLMLVGGIVQTVQAAQENPVDGLELATGIIRVIFFESAALIGWVGTLIGVGIMAYASE